MARLPIDFGDDDPQALADYTARLPIQLPEQWLGQNAANAVNNLFAPVGDVPRYQTWPEQMVRSGATLPGDVVAGRVPMGLGLRREDFTDIPDYSSMRKPADTWFGLTNKLGMREGPELGPSGELISRTQDLSGMAGGGSVAGVGREATLASSGMKKISEEYRGEHQSAGPDSGSPMHDVTANGTYPADFYSHNGLRYYGTGDDALDVISYRKIIDAKDNPDKMVRVYRAIPWEGKRPSVTLNGNNERSKINPGDWVTISKKYAQEHGEGALNGKYAIADKMVPAKEIFTSGDSLHEWGWHPSELLSDTSTNAPISALAKTPVFYSAVEKAVKEAKQNTATGEQWLGYLRNQPGVKQEELDWVLHELPKGQISKADLEQFVQEHKVELKEVNRGYDPEMTAKGKALAESEGWNWDDVSSNNRRRYIQRAADAKLSEDIGGPKHAQWQLPGGENYREQLLTLPRQKLDISAREQIIKLTSENERLAKNLQDAFNAGHDNYAEGLRHLIDINSQAIKNIDDKYISSHWDEPNVLAHIRTNERTIPPVAGGRNQPLNSLHIEEIQSDWHQAGRKQGYKGEKEDLQPKFDKIEQKILDSNDESVMSKPELKDALAEAVQKKIITADEAKTYARYTQIESGSAVPDAPFKASWADLALKRVIAEAARQGKDSISWTPGEAQAARYDLSKHIDHIAYNPNTGYFKAIDKSGKDISTGPVPKEKLADTIGKEAAEKLLATTPNNLGVHELKNADLKVGGEGMKGFYDKILVDKANAIAKKFGGKVEQGGIEGGKQKYEVTNYRDGSVQILDNAHEANQLANSDPAGIGVRTINDKQPIHVLRITPELRDAALNKGFALFADTGKVGAPLAALTKVEHNPFKLAELEKQHGVKLTPVENNPFQTDAYHGAPKPFVGTDIKTPELFSTDNPRLAGGNVTPIEGGYARSNRPLSEATGNSVMPLKLDTSKYHKIDAKGQPWQAVNQQAIFEANQLNKPGVIIKNVVDSPDSQIKTPQTIFITLDKSTARSKNAKFDPAKFGESGLLKAGGLPIYSDENGNQLLPTPKGLIRLIPVSHDPFKKEK